MKAIMVMFDSLNREYLSAYGCDWTKTPNFKRLMEKSVTFDQCYVGSMPCMPARRELHTGRYNFLHRSWGPLEPFDDSMPQILKEHGITSHLISDHQHYWEDGGCTYHTRYNSWEISRGQEGDNWKCEVDFVNQEKIAFQGMDMMANMRRQDQINRKYMQSVEETSQGQTFTKGLEFMDLNHQADNWFLQIETFDPHEPFFSLEEYKKLYPDSYRGDSADWPPYYFVQEHPEVIAHTKNEYAALLSMCDESLGKVLDKMDAYDLWKDTMLIVNTDHGYLLGEHGWWSKTVMPLYNEIAHTPLFVWNPKCNIANVRNNELVQTIDLAPTILDFFGLEIPKDMQGKSLAPVICNNTPIHDFVFYGYHGGHINVSDGTYSYMRAPNSRNGCPSYEYTLMPTHMRKMFDVTELQDITLQEPFSFSKGCRLMKIKATEGMVNAFNYGNKLYNLKQDFKQDTELDNPEVEAVMVNAIRDFLLENDAPQELYERYGIDQEACVSKEDILAQRKHTEQEDALDFAKDFVWHKEARNGMYALLQVTPVDLQEQLKEGFLQFIQNQKLKELKAEQIMDYIKLNVQGEQKEKALYFAGISCRVK